jgi:hypothetical protein
VSLRRCPLVRTLIASLMTTCALTACGGHVAHDVTSATRAPASRTPAGQTYKTLPNGGRIIFPAYRVVAYYGTADNRNLGVLGVGSPDDAGRRLLQQAKAYGAGGRPVLPAFELIATMAEASSNDDTYNGHLTDAQIQSYLDAARKIRALLILDVQPGRAQFLPEVRRYEKFLAEPDVELALDSEWKMASGEIPGQTIGGTDAAAVNAVSSYLAALVARDRLPQKLLIVHQFTDAMIEHRSEVIPRRGLAITFHIDGFGGRAAKLSKYGRLAVPHAPFFNGFKLFYHQDVRMFSAHEVLQMRPVPDLVTYE